MNGISAVSQSGGNGANSGRLKNWLHETFCDQAYPLFLFDQTIHPAASVWSGMRLWVRRLRELKAEKGSLIGISLSPSPAFLYLFFACLWNECVPVLIPPRLLKEDPGLKHFPPLSLLILQAETGKQNHKTMQPEVPAFSVAADGVTVSNEFDKIRDLPVSYSLDGVRFIVRSSGTEGPGRWIGLSERSLFANLDYHAVKLKETGMPEEPVFLSALPWHHSFGLVLDLLLGVFLKATVVVDKSGGRSAESILSLIRHFHCNWMSGVPAMFSEILQSDNDSAFSRYIQGGIIGGACISRNLAEALQGSGIRVGYGQTEAGPGILLGEPGILSPCFIGNPVGCEVKLASDGEILFRGPNSMTGFFENRKWKPAGTGWIGTSDIGYKGEEGFFFIGRKGSRFKLDNGLFFNPEPAEDTVRQKAGLDAVLIMPDYGKEYKRVLFAGCAERQQVQEILDELSFPFVAKAVHVPGEIFQLNAKGAVSRKKTIDQYNKYPEGKCNEC